MNITDASFSEYIKSISEEIVIEEIIGEARKDKESVLVDFKLNKGKMSGVGNFNTWIRFDTAENTVLNKILIKMTGEEEPSEEDIQVFESWRKNVSDRLISDFVEKVKEVVCDSVFGGDRNIPFKILSSDLEITDIPKNDKVVVVKKASPPGTMTPAVSSDIMMTHEETGESFEQIVNRKKAEGDPRYRWVVGVDSRKSFYEITLSIAVDYSIPEERNSSSEEGNEAPVE